MAVIDASAFPHIFDLIVTWAPPEALLVLRATSKELRDRIDAQRLRHIVIKDIDRDTSVFETQLEAPGVGARPQFAPLSWRFDAGARMSTPWIETMQKHIRVVDVFLPHRSRMVYTFKFPFLETRHINVPLNPAGPSTSEKGGPAKQALAFDIVRRAHHQEVDIPATTYIDFVLLHAKFDYPSFPAHFRGICAPHPETQKWVISVHYGLEKDDQPLAQISFPLHKATGGGLTHVTYIFTNTSPNSANAPLPLDDAVIEDNPLGLLGEYMVLLQHLPRKVDKRVGGWAPLHVTLVGAEDIPAGLLHLETKPTRKELNEAIIWHFGPLWAIPSLNFLTHDEYRRQVGLEQYELEALCPSSILALPVGLADDELDDDFEEDPEFFEDDAEFFGDGEYGEYEGNAEFHDYDNYELDGDEQWINNLSPSYHYDG